MDEITQKNMNEIMNSLSETWKGLLVSAGYTSGLFNILSPEKPVTINEIIKQTGFDVRKLESWLYYMEYSEMVIQTEYGYILTPKGSLLHKKSPYKDLTGLLQLTEFYMDASLNAAKTFEKGNSLDKLSQGKISRNYQPKVSDNFSTALIDILKKFSILSSDSLLDVGCGQGTFLMSVYRSILGVKLTGMDSNLFAIERGKEEINKNDMSDRINLLVGNIIEDLEEVKSSSYDWVTLINVFHFIPANYRQSIIEEMIRIAKKGVLTTQVVVEKSELSRSADPLMNFLWNDFTGFFQEKELDEMNNKIIKKYPLYICESSTIMHGNSTLFTIIKK